MAVSLKHKFANPKSDTPDTTVARASDWNDEHDLTLAANRVLGRKTAGNGPVEELTGADLRAIADVEQAGVVAGINTRTTSYTLALSDRGKVIEMDVATANTVTVPNEAGLSGVDFPIGTRIVVVQKGTGATTLTPAPGVTVLTSATELGTTSRYSSLVLYKRAANEWVMEKPIDYEAAAAASQAAAAASEANAANSALSAASSSSAAGAASGRLEVGLFSDLATVFGYSTAGGRRAVVTGDLIKVISINSVYQVVASGATDAHLDYTGSGGVKLNVMAGDYGFNIKAFGAKGDGVTNDRAVFVTANSIGKAIYVPSGNYYFASSFSSSGTAAWSFAPDVKFSGTQPVFERGAWSANAPDGSTGGNGVNIHRLWDRVLIGDANLGYNGELGPGTTWASNYGVGYFQATGQTVSFSGFGGIGISAASQSVDTPSSVGVAIGTASAAVNNSTGNRSAWAYYGLAVQTAGSGGTFTAGMELNVCSEKVSNDPNPFNIESGINIPHTHWVGVGGEYPQILSANCKPISAGMIFASNSYRNAVAGTGNLFRRGIVFQADSILGTDGSAGRGIAISFAKGHSLEWDFQSSGFTFRGSRIRSDVNSISNTTGIVFDNAGVNFVKIDSSPSVSTESRLLRIEPITSPVNNLALKPSASGNPLELLAEGADSNIDISISPKGGGVLRYNLPFNPLSGETLSGFMYIRDSSNTLRKVAIVA